MGKEKDIVISSKTVLFTFLFLIAAYVVYKLGPIFKILLISWLLVISVEHAVQVLMRITFLNKPLSRGAAVLITYLFLIVALILIFTAGLPPILMQAQKLVANLSAFLSQPRIIGGIEISLAQFLPNASDLSTRAISITYGVVSNFASIITVLFLSLYMSLDWENIKTRFSGLFSGRIQEKVAETLSSIEVEIGHWVKGALLLMLVVGALSFVGFALVGVSYPLALALIAGILEIVPIIGPIITAVLATMVGFTVSPVKGFITLGVCVLVQQLENNFLVPKIMHKVSGFSPLVVLIAILVGSHFFGLMGAVIAVPVAMVLGIIVREVRKD